MSILARTLDFLRVSGGDARPQTGNVTATKKIVIVGSPNVGKSVLFNRLTGTYVTVSNYPGTTVEVSEGRTTIAGQEYEVIDTPGTYSLFSITEEERVTQRILIKDRFDVVLHVIDAKNVERMLPLTLQLVEAGLPVILVLNIFDEAEKIGMRIDLPRLEAELGIPVVATVAMTGRGIETLKERIRQPRPGRSPSPAPPSPGNSVQAALEKIEGLLTGQYGLSRRTVGLLLLQEDREILSLVRSKEPEAFRAIMDLVNQTRAAHSAPLPYVISLRRQQAVSDLVARVVEYKAETTLSFNERLSRIMIRPLTGIPILLLVLYLGIYQFVGNFGAGVLVDLIETDLFEAYVTPHVVGGVTSLIPWPMWRDLFVGEYGILTLGLRYAVALILPIVTTFFIAFAVIEDTGYLPRLALLIDRLFKTIGLTGRAVIPMVLGLGCDTMATMVTRTLPTARERLISTILLALAVPCSAQLGVILSLLEGNPKGLWIWLGVLCFVFLFIGYLSSRILPGDAPSFYMEIPPLRLPSASNVLIKTYSRVKWYFMEILPMFLLASVIIWLGQLTGLFAVLIRGLEYPIRWIGLPHEAAVAFLFGFFRRDYGAGGLYDLKKAGLLSGNQLVVACVTLTLFLPCIAQFLMNVKERGWKTAMAISTFILFFAFTGGYLVHLALTMLRVRL